MIRGIAFPFLYRRKEVHQSPICPSYISVPPPSNLVVSFDWNQLGRPSLRGGSIPFRIIIVQIYRMVMAGTIIDEGASVSIISSTAWKALGSPTLLPEMRNLTGFDKGTSRPLGILPNVPVTKQRENCSNEHDGSPRSVRL